MSGSAYSSAALARSARHFIAGKAVSAIMSVVILLWLVRALPVEEYAAYVTFVAAIEMAYALSFVGLPWLAARYLPEYRIHAPARRLKRLCWQLIGWHGAIAAGLAALLAALLGLYLDRFGLSEYRTAAEIYLLVMLAEAAGRFAREGVLGALLRQDIVQISLALRSFVFLAVLVAYSSNGPLRLEHVAWAELAASVLAAAIAFAGLVRTHSYEQPQTPTVGWIEPKMGNMWMAALKMYASQLLTLTYSPQLVVNMIQFWLGAGAAAAFGFLRNLYDLIGRYLPATLMFSLVRPKLVSSYVHAGDIAALSRNANLVGKISLAVLLPVVAFVAAEGDLLVGKLSGGKFTEAGMYFFGLLLALIPFSQRQLLETVAVATGHAGECFRAAVAGLAVPLLIFGLLAAGLGLWAGVIGIGIGHLLFDAVVLLGTARKTGFRADLTGVFKIIAAGLAGFLLAATLPGGMNTLLQLAATAAVTLAGFLMAAWFLRPFADDERVRIMEFLRRGLLRV